MGRPAQPVIVRCVRFLRAEGSLRMCGVNSGREGKFSFREYHGEDLDYVMCPVSNGVINSIKYL